MILAFANSICIVLAKLHKISEMLQRCALYLLFGALLCPYILILVGTKIYFTAL